MSYQVLARKWRPARFQEMVGQEHVLKALVNALDDDRLHHAYLFTGTRGVGKTSIARLFAKSLNCETGVSSSPCGECSACREISEGRFVDLIEVDAASRTKVEDTRELLENVQYAPTHGRFKVYLIDEVHMLSTHSFNALLKTLEEPPPHVKFLLATTDPQKLPVTILSRCLQFNLKNMIPERIVDHLSHVLKAEQISYEEPALWLLARSADGSMRDAMSLTDQAIAFGAGEIKETDVRSMLGTIDQRLVYRLVECLVAHNPRSLLEAVDELSRFSPDYNTVLGDLISLLHRIALAQIVPDAVDNGMGDRERVLELAGALRAEDVQLFYQTALIGRKDLPFVPDAREGLEMVLLRMLAFRPAGQKAETLAPVSTQPNTDDANPSIEENSVASVAEITDTTSNTSAQPDDVHQESSQSAPVNQASVDQSVVGAQSADTDPVAQVQNIEEAPSVEPPPVAADIPSAPNDYDDSYIQDAQEYHPEDTSVKKPEAEDSPPWEVDDSSVVSVQVTHEIVADHSVRSDEKAAVDPIVNAASAQAVAPPKEAIAEPAETLCSNVQELDVLQWVLLVDLIGISGMTYSIAANTSLESVNGNSLKFHYAAEQKALINEVHIERIREAIGQYFNTTVEVEFSLGDFGQETPSQYRHRKRAERLAEAVSAMENDSVVQTLIERFSGQLDVASIEPID